MKLIINGDDLGISSVIDAGIIKAYKDGILTDATIIVNQDIFKDTIQLCKEHDIPVGVHLNLTFGEPILNSHKTLVDKNGVFFNENIVCDENNYFDKEEIKNEFSAQIEKVLAEGIDVTHLDSHHHVHWAKNIKEAFFEVAKKYSLSFRPAKDWDCQFSYLGTKEKLYFDDCFFGDGATVHNLIETLKKYEGKTLALMSHPRLGDLMFSHPITEVDVLTSKEVKDFIKENNIQLISYKDLKY